jgi:hypothetical protein
MLLCFEVIWHALIDNFLQIALLPSTLALRSFCTIMAHRFCDSTFYC